MSDDVRSRPPTGEPKTAMRFWSCAQTALTDRRDPRCVSPSKCRSVFKTSILGHCLMGIRPGLRGHSKKMDSSLVAVSSLVTCPYRTPQRSIPCRLGRFQKLQYLVHQSITLTRLEYELCVGRALQDYKMLRRRHFLVVFAHFCQSNRTAPVRVVARHDE